MSRLIKLSLYSLSAFFVAAFYFSVVSFAQGDTVCSGSVSGKTGFSNVNGGQTFFDTHPGQQGGVVYDFSANVGVNDILTILGILPDVSGQFAPGSVGDAACVHAASGTAIHNGVSRPYDYQLRGWAWNNNIGFISFSCISGVNNSGSPDAANPSAGSVACGSVDYGVYVGPDLGGGARQVFGYAWSPSLGWLQFDTPISGFPNQLVSMNAAGNLTGAIWSEAGIWLDFSNVNLNLVEADNPATPPGGGSGPGWCSCRAFICAEVEPSPGALTFGDLTGSDVKVADGVDGYYIHLYLRDESGTKALDTAAYGFDPNSIVLEWTDTVKLDQTDYKNLASPALATTRNPFDSSLGAVSFKPLTFADFVPVSGDPGHYISMAPVSSFAPTSESNLSYTTSTKPVFAVKNETFINDIGIGPLESNQLILERITFDPIVAPASGTAVDPDTCTISDPFTLGEIVSRGPIYPDGRTNMPLRFRAPIEVDTLYSGVDEDKIQAYRSVPVTTMAKARSLGALSAAVLNTATIDFNLAYSLPDTQNQPSCQNESNPVASNFDFSFVGTGKSKLSLILSELASPTPLQLIATLPQYTSLPPDQQSLVLPCDFAEAPSLYSVISYVFKGQTITYFSNKLPRLGGSRISNPEVVVHGNIYGQSASNVSSKNVVQSAGDVNVSVVRDTVNENLQKYLGDVSVTQGGNCTIQALTTVAYNNFITNCTSNYRATFIIGSGSSLENVMYFKGTDVHLNLNAGAWANNWVIIADEGNIYIDGNIYDGASSSDKLTLIAFRGEGNSYYSTGNVYIAPCDASGTGVKNIQATIIADGTVFSYDGTPAGIDGVTGEPVWADYNSMVSGLSCQLLIEGAIYSDNTIGGADLDAGDNPKPYLLIGGGRVLTLPLGQTERMRAQYFDLNYLRLFKLDVQLNRQGLPIDQKCGKALTAEDILNINSGVTVCGDRAGCDPNASINQTFACDGINPLTVYTGNGSTGDLMPPQNPAILAQGLNNTIGVGTDFDPIYVYFRQPDKKSFVFSKPGALSAN